MDCEERLVTQAAMVKEVNPRTKVWVYRATPVSRQLAQACHSAWF